MWVGWTRPVTKIFAIRYSPLLHKKRLAVRTIFGFSRFLCCLKYLTQKVIYSKRIYCLKTHFNNPETKINYRSRLITPET